MSQAVDRKSLRPGDVLLMRGDSEISDLVAWFGDSIYSHAAILVDRGELVEAAPPQSRIRTLEERLHEVQHYFFIDAWRPARRNGQPLADADRGAIVDAARALVATPYPVDAFVQMAVFAALRNRVPADRRARELLRAILDHVLKKDPNQVTCSELVYRALASANQHGATDVEPPLIVSATLDTPFPSVNVAKLWEEWNRIRPRASDGTGVPAFVSIEDSTAHPDDDEAQLTSLLADFESLRSARGLAPFYTPDNKPRPNPRNVLPVDLESSPSIRFLGRLKLST